MVLIPSLMVVRLRTGVLSLQGTSGGHGAYGSQGGAGVQGNPGPQGTPWASGGNYGTNSLGGSVGQGGNGGPLNYETNAQVKSLPRPVPQPCSLHPSLFLDPKLGLWSLPPCRELWLSLATGQ